MPSERFIHQLQWFSLNSDSVISESEFLVLVLALQLDSIINVMEERD